MSARIVKAFGFVASKKFIEDCNYNISYFLFGERDQFFVGIELERKQIDQMIFIGDETNHIEEYNKFIDSAVERVLKSEGLDVHKKQEWIESLRKSVPTLNVFLSEIHGA